MTIDEVDVVVAGRESCQIFRVYESIRVEFFNHVVVDIKMLQVGTVPEGIGGNISNFVEWKVDDPKVLETMSVNEGETWSNNHKMREVWKNVIEATGKLKY